MSMMKKILMRAKGKKPMGSYKFKNGKLKAKKPNWQKPGKHINLKGK